MIPDIDLRPILVLAGIGLLSLIGGGLWLLYWIVTNVSIVIR